ncbi:hypothetical protein BH11MYX4_BH11MYX4_10160 [soil metagenome]
MASPTTTHVIEIEAGIGEPAFIPLSMGHELQPISVGKKGMWRLESPRVLDVHAFVYFDGSSLFLQSADESNAASVDGFRVGKAWTELHAPCKIEIGQARLRFRSLLADDNQATEMALSPPVQTPPGGPGTTPGSSMPVAAAPPAPQRMQTGQRAAVPQPPSSNPVAFPKAERPFKPGEFASAPDEGESTRIAPLETTGGGRMASGAHARPPMQVQGAMTEMPPHGFGPPQGFDQGFDPNQMPPQPQGFDPHQPPYGAPQGYPNGGGSGAYGAMGPGAMSGPGMPQGPMGTGPYGSMSPQGAPQHNAPPAAGMQQLVAKLKENSIPKIVAGLLFIIGGILYLSEDDDPPPKRKPVATLDAGAAPSSASSAAPVSPPVMPPNPFLPAWPPGVPCPPANWPPNTPLPCVPNGLTQQADPPTPPVRGSKDAGAPAAVGGTKTLERQAVDFVAAGDTAKAAAAYEELVRREPNNKVYAEAARILRAKLDGGAQ